jgi:acetoin utilization deacetylase AcuC-like enzyme
MTVITDERCLGYGSLTHPERPARVGLALQKLQHQQELPLDWDDPLAVDEQIVLRAHSWQHVTRLKLAEEDFDADTAAYPDIFEHALRAVGGALKAWELARKGTTAFSLMRPPGHHALNDRAMGFCYLNNVAIAALAAVAAGARKVAVYDFDVHHGNGTEAILLNHPQVVFFSVHQYPGYPGTGSGPAGNNCFNYPVAPYSPRDAYRVELDQALERLHKLGPDLLAVSAGFDAYVHDPIAQGTLEAEDYHWLGERIRSLGIPCFHVLEGGYSHDLPELILAYLKGLAGK